MLKALSPKGKADENSTKISLSSQKGTDENRCWYECGRELSFLHMAVVPKSWVLVDSRYSQVESRCCQVSMIVCHCHMIWKNFFQ